MAENEKIKIDFLGFNEDNTISDIREFFNDEKNSDCIMSFYETYYNNNVNEEDQKENTIIAENMNYLYAFIRALFDKGENAYKRLVEFCVKKNKKFDKEHMIELCIEQRCYLIEILRDGKVIKKYEGKSLSDLFSDLRRNNYTLKECLSRLKTNHVRFYACRYFNKDGEGKGIAEYPNTIIESSDGIYHIKGLAEKDMQGEALNAYKIASTKASEYRNSITRIFYKEIQRIKEEKEKNIFVKCTVKDKLAILLAANNKQIVLTGAPGTGKTYGVREYIKTELDEGYENSDRFKFVQFHSSFDYTDFVEGLKPIEDENGNTEFRRVDGVFKAFCRKAEKAIQDKIPNKINEDTIINGESLKDHPYFEQAKRNVAEAGYYYFVIDEINRADLSRVFGEIMFCLEESYRGPKNKINTQYQSLKTYDADGKLMENDVFADGFYIPENVIIIGTMNDIDRSVETFDFALRRRFKWEEVGAMESMEDLGLDKNGDLYKRINALNKAIEKHLGKDFQLGMAYFRKAKEQGDNFDPETYYNEELKFILNEYVRGMNDKDAKLKDFEQKFTDNAKANGQQ